MDSMVNMHMRYLKNMSIFGFFNSNKYIAQKV